VTILTIDILSTGYEPSAVTATKISTIHSRNRPFTPLNTSLVLASNVGSKRAKL
jgi:hypothetical protein